MAGIAGIAKPGHHRQVEQMLERIRHRGPAGADIIETPAATIGVVWPKYQSALRGVLLEEHTARDGAGVERLAEGRAINGRLLLLRDRLGVAPLYYGRTDGGALCFASEVKALLPIAGQVYELPPGSSYDGTSLRRRDDAAPPHAMHGPAEGIAPELRRRLDNAVARHVDGPRLGCWLSGGLDSSVIAALARPRVSELHTFSVGVTGAPDLQYAREVATALHTQHHELAVTPERLVEVLPQVIGHLESFDALLVRSSVTNFLIGRLAAQHVPAVFSGEAADELFAGYEYLKAFSEERLPGELADITARLHNTAFQRVDRCSAAHGLVAHVPFADPEVVEYAQQIPAAFKIRGGMEKWILRKVAETLLPPMVAWRPKEKFWQGAGVGELLAEHAAAQLTDADFHRERRLPNGWRLNSKEELLYYRLFHEQVGRMETLSWMGRTKGAPGAGTPAAVAERSG